MVQRKIFVSLLGFALAVLQSPEAVPPSGLRVQNVQTADCLDGRLCSPMLHLALIVKTWKGLAFHLRGGDGRETTSRRQFNSLSSTYQESYHGRRSSQRHAGVAKNVRRTSTDLNSQDMAWMRDHPEDSLRRDRGRRRAGERRSDFEPGKMFVTGLPHGCSTSDLTRAFCDYGEVAHAFVAQPEDGKPRGFGFVSFKDSNIGIKLIRLTMEGKETAYVNGRAVIIRQADTRVAKVTEREVKDAARSAQMLQTEQASAQLHTVDIAHTRAQRWDDLLLAQAGVIDPSDFARRHRVDREVITPEEKVTAISDLSPPFLAEYAPDLGKVEPVEGQLCRDPTSAMMQIAAQTPLSLQMYRQRRLALADQRSWDPAKREEKPVEEEAEDDERFLNPDGTVDHRRKHSFAVQHAPADTSAHDAADDHAAAGVNESDASNQTDAQGPLPIHRCKTELLRALAEHQVVVVVGETGCGKSTQLPQFLAERLHAGGDRRRIGCTQPRRVAAMSVAKRVADERREPLGQSVGYAIRFQEVLSGRTRIKYMTDGILLRETLQDPLLEQYAAVIMDEAHERSLNTDILFGILRRLLRRRSDLSLVVTSATLDADKFSRFFAFAPVFNIPGITFPVTVHHTAMPVEDYLNEAVRQVLSLHVGGGDPGDMLVFLPGQEEVVVAAELLLDRARMLNDTEVRVPPLDVLPIYGSLPAEMQVRIFRRAGTGARKVIFATNIAETSLTVHGITRVVDCGYARMKCFNPKLGMEALLLVPESQANARQRSGRAGRTAPGECFRLFTRHALDHEMLPSSPPEITRCNLANVILLLKSLGVRNLLDYELMDPPPRPNMLDAMCGAPIQLGRRCQLCTTSRGSLMW